MKYSNRYRAISQANKQARELKSNNSPSEGQAAWDFWRNLSSPYVLDAPTAAKLYRKAGYVPFSGYPLARS